MISVLATTSHHNVAPQAAAKAPKSLWVANTHGYNLLHINITSTNIVNSLGLEKHFFPTSKKVVLVPRPNGQQAQAIQGVLQATTQAYIIKYI